MRASNIARIGMLACMISACGGSRAPAPAPAPVAAPGPSAAELAAQRAQQEQTQRAQEVETHRKIESQQQDALAATCTEPEPHEPHARCLPSCYPTEAADPRAGKKLTGAVAIEHLVCEAPDADAGTYVLADEVAGATLQLRKVRGRFPAAHKKGSWQAEIESWFADAAGGKPARGDVFVVSGGWRGVTHPLIKARLRCVTLAHYTRAMHAPLGGCGVEGDLGCEAAGNPAARGINVVHYRLAEAKALRAAGKLADCQQAALEAIAIGRGLPRWRQYAKLNVAHWDAHPAYRTRFDGTLDEDTLFDRAATLAGEAAQVYAACGGPAEAVTTPEQEQSFHTCW